MVLTLRNYRDLDAFERDVTAFLRQREAEHNLLLGVLSGLRAGEFSEEAPYLVTAFDGDEVAAVALRTPPHRLLVSESIHPDEVAAALVADLDGVAVPGVLAPPSFGESFARQWESRTAVRLRIAQRERIYRLDAVTVPPPQDGELVSATVTERSLVSDWFAGFGNDTGEYRTARDAQLAAETWLNGVTARQLFLWKAGGEPVAMAGVTGATPNGIRVGAVYTPPALRRQGHATACVAALSQRMLDQGRKFCFLFTDLANPTSNHIYQTIGYRPVSDVTAWDAV